MTRILLFAVMVAGTCLLSSAGATPSLYFDFSDVAVKADERLELPCGVESHFRHCVWETERGDVFQVEDVHAGLHPNMRASSNLTHNQCGIVVEALSERSFGKWTCRVYFAGFTLRAERTVGKAMDCPSPFIPVGTSCYYIFHEGLYTWEDSRSVCQGLHPSADLAVLDDCHQFQLVWNRIIIDYGSDWYWLGGAANSQDGSWHWVNGEAVTMGTPFWKPEEPSGDGLCLHLSRSYGYFYDVSCLSKFYFVCQILN